VLSVFLVDDHEVVRRGVADLIDDEPDMAVIGQAATASQAMARVPALRPDIVLLEVRLPDGNGIELCRDLKSVMPELNCLMLTSFTDEQAMMDAILAGAGGGGYIIKDIKGMDLLAAVRTVGAGRSLLDNRAAAALIRRLREGVPHGGRLADLTDQERTVLDLVGQGMTNRQIGERMFLAEKIVKNYVSRLLAKLGMERRTQVAVLAIEVRGQRSGTPRGCRTAVRCRGDGSRGRSTDLQQGLRPQASAQESADVSATCPAVVRHGDEAAAQIRCGRGQQHPLHGLTSTQA
jgi:two-component system response regulator DevR